MLRAPSSLGAPRRPVTHDGDMRRAVGGAVAWISIAQYFVVEELVRRSWTLPYSRRANYISDLGALTCGRYKGRQICSPDHASMNLSFGLVGAAIGVGALLVRRRQPAVLSIPTTALYVAAGAGSVVVGLFPEDTIGALHVLGTGVFFVGANLGHVLLGTRLRRRGSRYGTVLAVVGAVGLVGTVLTATGVSLGAGIGLVERVVVYGADGGFIVTGLLLLGSPGAPGRVGHCE